VKKSSKSIKSKNANVHKSPKLSKIDQKCPKRSKYVQKCPKVSKFS
jgi:hypothetical protein